MSVQPILDITTLKGRGAVQLEEGVRDLQHQDVRMVVLMTDQDPFTSPAHTMLTVMLF